ncbi:hypothetical protein EB796_022677 [Bugula neritina]|uniref:Uncharacterized protein n=1 Tax=Bugula neritina TaxID=10212 RepID=A0A7J7IYP5_BUGNE|nr:hypothetical protein EB796_022677 [Bugula neritina]
MELTTEDQGIKFKAKLKNEIEAPENMEQLWVVGLTHGVDEYILDSSEEEIKIHHIEQQLLKPLMEKEVTTFHI